MHASLDMTFLYTQNDEAREREHVAQIMDRIKSGPNLAAMTPGREGFVIRSATQALRG
jgi:hypothetical protein